jgi:uncharacterized membrane protein YgcG
MEKYSKFRDRGSGVAPFLPPNTPSSAPVTILHAILFLVRLPFFLTYALTYFLVLHPLLRASTAILPRVVPVIARKLLLWLLMGIPGIWWMDLQLDGVKRGHLAEQPVHRFPGPRTVVASTFTSPIDAIYLAAIFDPVFTISYPNTRLVRRVGLIGAMKAALMPVRFGPRKPSTRLTDLETLLEENPERVVAVFPECGTTNGKAILPFSPSLLACPSHVPIYPVSIRYSPPDVTTPIPGRWLRFLWHLLSRPTTCIRVRIAEPTTNSVNGAGAEYSASSFSNGGHGSGSGRASTSGSDAGSSVKDVTYGPNGVEMLPTEQRVLDRISETLARLGMSKRVSLTLKDKAAFVEAWNKRLKQK